jgi:acyl-CoA synthetase (AMP-forming)/AMP-acid ligase II
MVPSMMYQLLNHPDFSKVDLDNLESVNTGASRLHNDLREKFEHRANNVPFLAEGIYIPHFGGGNLTDRPP